MKTHKLVVLAKSIAAQDEFTYTTNTPLPLKQAYDIINAWRTKAKVALEAAKLT